MRSGQGDGRLEEVMAMLKGLRGVWHVFEVTPEARRDLKDLERSYPRLGPLTIENTGVAECLKREHVVCMIKDRTFRAPPQPTVVLVSDDGTVVGHEVFDGQKVSPPQGKETFFLGKGFVVFYNRESSKNARFVLPPVTFEEVERLGFTRRVVSCSPSTVGDKYLREAAGLEDDPALASILIGFDFAAD